MCTSIGSVKVPNHKDSFRLRLLLTDGCNQNCSYCLNDFQEKPKGEPQYLKMGKILKAVREYLQFSRTIGYKPEIYLSGGEPTLHPRILDIIESIQDLYQAEICNGDHKHLPWSKLRLVVCTNGNIKISLRNKLKKLQKKYKNIFFTVSLHLNHWPSKKWCHEVKANYSMVLTGKAFDYKKIMVDVFPKSLCDLMTIMVNAREKVKCLSIGIFYREYFNHKCHLKVLDNFHAPNPMNYEMKVNWVKRGIESTGKPCTVEMRPYKATNCLGCEDICCSHKSYWVRPDGTTSHCPKFKEVYHETIDTQLVPTIDVERAYGNHKSTYSTIKDILQSAQNMNLRHEGMIQMVDEEYVCITPNQIHSLKGFFELPNVWLDEQARKQPNIDYPVLIAPINKERLFGVSRPPKLSTKDMMYDEYDLPSSQVPLISVNSYHLASVESQDICEINTNIIFNKDGSKMVFTELIPDIEMPKDKEND